MSTHGSTDAERAQQLTAVVTWLDEVSAWIVGDIEVAIEEGDLQALPKFKQEQEVVANLRGMAQAELQNLKRIEKQNAARKLDEWRQAVGK